MFGILGLPGVFVLQGVFGIQGLLGLLDLAGLEGLERLEGSGSEGSCFVLFPTLFVIEHLHGEVGWLVGDQRLIPNFEFKMVVSISSFTNICGHKFPTDIFQGESRYIFLKIDISAHTFGAQLTKVCLDWWL